MTAMLHHLKGGQFAVIRAIHGGETLRRRLGSFGLHPGDTLEVVRSGFLGGPVLIAIHGAEVAIGQGQARKIEVDVPEPA